MASALVGSGVAVQVGRRPPDNRVSLRPVSGFSAPKDILGVIDQDIPVPAGPRCSAAQSLSWIKADIGG
jgi:hypothetical protein